MSYSIAEVVTYNKDTIRYELRGHYIKAKSMTREDALYYIEEGVKGLLCHIGGYTIDEVDKAFGDEQVKTLIEVLFLKEFIYEH